MKILEKIPSMDRRRLAQLKENCSNIVENGPESKRADAVKILSEIEAELNRRLEEESERQRASREETEIEMRDKPLFERVLRAFEKLPPRDAELKWLRVLAANPGADIYRLAAEAGSKSGGTTNLKIGSICRIREHYLGSAPPNTTRAGEKLYSALLVDFEHHKDESGKVWTGWRLKQEAEAALCHLGILN